MQVLVDAAPGMGKKGGVGRTYADAPEIDGTVKLLPPEKISKTLKVGEFTKARIVGTQGHGPDCASCLRKTSMRLQEFGELNFMQTTKKPLKKIARSFQRLLIKTRSQKR